MRVLTFNIAGNRGKARPEHLELVAEWIRVTKADIVGLQEVVHFRDRTEPPDELLARLTGMQACFLPAHQRKQFCLGNAVLCREPIVQTVSHELPHTFPERRVLLEVETTAHGLPVTVFCTHLVHLAGAGARMRLVQATAVAALMGRCWRPHLLMGDLNAAPHSRQLRPIRELLDTPDHLNGLRTWPARRPWILYDQIWPGPGWVVEATEVLQSELSDHRALLAQLGWKGAPRYHIMPDEAYGPHSLRR